MTDDVIAGVAITDYDFVREIEDGTNKYTTCGTRGYRSPEVVDDNKYSTYSDIWALGIVMIDLMLVHHFSNQ